MKIKLILVLLLLLTGCANLQSPKETNVAVSVLLNEIQIAINEINSKTTGDTSLPPFKSAEVKLSTKAGITSGGSASLVLSGEQSNTTTDSNILTLELVPNPISAESFTKSTGHDIAEYVIAAVSAVDANKFLKLNSLTVEAGLVVLEKSGGGIEVELVGVAIKGGRSGETTNSHNLKLIFAQPKPKDAK